jgi:uncharacterized membrane protein
MAGREKPQLRGAFELFSPSIELLKKYPDVFGVLLVLPAMLVGLGSTTDSTSTILITPFTTFGGLLALIFLGPMTYAATRAAGGHEVSLSESFEKGFPYFLRLLGLLIVLVAVITVGFLLLIIPGVIFVRRYVLAPYYLVDQNLGIFEAMSQSAKETKPFSWDIYAVLGVTLLIGFVGVFGFVGNVASTVLSVLYGLAFPLRYFEIKKAYKKL